MGKTFLNQKKKCKKLLKKCIFERVRLCNLKIIRRCLIYFLLYLLNEVVKKIFFCYL